MSWSQGKECLGEGLCLNKDDRELRLYQGQPRAEVKLRYSRRRVSFFDVECSERLLDATLMRGEVSG